MCLKTGLMQTWQQTRLDNQTKQKIDKRWHKKHPASNTL